MPRFASRCIPRRGQSEQQHGDREHRLRLDGDRCGAACANGRPADEPPVARVIGKAEREVADAILQAKKVKARLLDQLGRMGFSIDVEAKDGAVVLSGTVPDAERRRLAVDLAGRTPGVSSVGTLLKTAS